MVPPTEKRLSGVVPLLVAVGGGVLALSIAGPISSLDLALPLLWAGGWLLLLTLATFGAGELLLPLRDDDDLLEQLTLTLAAGAGVLIAVAGLLGACHLFHGPLLIAVLALAACRGGLRASRITWPRPPRITSPAFAILMAIVGLVSLLAATAPSPFYDQWNYHLAMPFHWLREGRIITFPRQAFSFLPANASLLFSYGLAGPGPWAAQVTSWWAGLLCAGFAACLGRRIAPTTRPGALAAALIVTCPMVAEMSTAAGSDLLTAAFGGAAWIAVLRLTSGESGWRIRDAMICGAFLGLACGTKLTAVLVVAVATNTAAMIAGLFDVRSRSLTTRRLLATVAFVVLISITLLAPWMTRNAVVAGSPLYPYFAWSVSRSEQSSGQQPPLTSPEGFVAAARPGVAGDRLLVAATLGATGTIGHAARLGPLFLTLAPLVLFDTIRARRSASVRSSMILGAGTAVAVSCWAVLPPIGRFAAPILVPLAAVCASSACRNLRAAPRVVRFGLSAALVTLMLGGLNPLRMSYVVPQLRVALGGETGEELLRRGVSSWVLMEAANRLLPPDAVALLVAETRSFGFQSRLIVEDPLGVPLLVELARESQSWEDLLDELRRRGVTHILVNWREARRLSPTGHPKRFLDSDNPNTDEKLAAVLNQCSLVWHHGDAEILALPPSLAGGS